MVDSMHQTGITIILFLQSMGDWLIAPMRVLTFTGNEDFYLIVAPALYWSIHAATGLRVALLLMISGAVNYALKLVFHLPRPFWFDARVRALAVESSFGIPSGHSQNAVVVWGTIAAAIARPWAWISAGILIFLIGMSRLVLGMHFPSDVIVGWIAGALLVWLLFRLEAPVRAWVRQKSLPENILAAFVVSLALILIGALARLSLGAWVVPEGWVALALRALPEDPFDALTPTSLAGVFTTGGAFFGLAAGVLWLAAQGGFSASGTLPQRLLRFPLGLLGVLLIWRGLDLIFPDGDFLLAYSLRYLRYALIGLWITGLAPWIFVRLRLAGPHTPSAIPLRKEMKASD